LRTISADPKNFGAELGFFAVLHTWGQVKLHHPHLHCVVAGGGLSAEGSRWIACRRNFFLPVRVLARLFRLCSWNIWRTPFDADKLSFSAPWRRFPTAASFCDIPAPPENPNGSSTPNHPLPDPNRC
jgi:hypothetical protein